MALSRLDSLYMAVVAEHSKNPHHHGVLPDVEQLQLNNPTCGDVINLSVRFKGDVIEDIAFAGDGCSISTASSSMMTDVVLGKTKKQALELAEIFSKMVQGTKDEEQNQLGEAKLLAGVSKFPQRIKCATLSWNALKKAIERSDTPVTDR
ncbi:Fe-S cluster assembly sulfur transfer protein SufU [Streptococcus sp. DD13]|uniref:Fe-S cluster assembly sulfur transfer protein SufU n=1 Tax=Streptococcus sp. DD13 TaxID=1777881 RepID=UPI00079C5054|nr:SUF system NifU family Fe-S cluster assembly protein [Streptococcus sp. DD13]KXT77606.1 putative iron-sulfur cluster assembly scaffold protein for SUF system, SufE2 [Streptococcus sp. DD13]